ncbi:thioredoxin family protein [Portibacter marinus]|uniref:thioredoxin family protein n=1 Tax=Portibacter marinus TaxID=2898660 RepID=UPI001F2EDBD7|nr:thioredoxin family protein [Portibacter marinus]
MKNFVLRFAMLLLTASVLISATIPGDGYKIGDTATDFELKNVNGEMVSLSDYPDAKGYIVIFTCNECPYAKMYEDRINDLNNKYASQGYPVIAIMPNDPNIQPGDSYENMQQRAESKGFTFPYLIDEGQEVFPQYGASKTPHVFLLNADKVVKYIGAIDNNARDAASADQKYVEDAIQALEAGNDPDPATTKAIGCGIKVKS